MFPIIKLGVLLIVTISITATAVFAIIFSITATAILHLGQEIEPMIWKHTVLIAYRNQVADHNQNYFAQSYKKKPCRLYQLIY